jgi:hypothetical protein
LGQSGGGGGELQTGLDRFLVTVSKKLSCLPGLQCDPEDSISQFTPPRLASLKVKAPPSNVTDLTASGQNPEHYFYYLMKADMRGLLEPIPPTVHEYLVESFDVSMHYPSW